MATWANSQPARLAAAMAGATAGDAMADAVEAAELLDVDVDDLAGLLALVAWPGLLRLEAGEQAEAAALEDARDAGLGDAELSRDVLLGAALTAQSLDGIGCGERRFGLAMKGVLRSGRANQRRPRALKRATHLATVLGVVLNRRAAAALLSPLLHNGADHLLSTFGREAGIVVGVHSVPRRIVAVWRHQRSRSGPNGQPPESSQLVRQRYASRLRHVPSISPARAGLFLLGESRLRCHHELIEHQHSFPQRVL